MQVLDGMIKAHVAWVPTLDIYEASRDLQRAQTQPWFADYLHPTLEEYFRPDPANHGSYFIGWSSTDEALWKENYRIWMGALMEFERRGGLIGVGDEPTRHDQKGGDLRPPAARRHHGPRWARPIDLKAEWPPLRPPGVLAGWGRGEYR